MTQNSKALPPRTQSDRRAQTRKALLEATTDVLLADGYHGCSLSNVAKRAGVTTGAVQHHFKTKGQLMLAVVKEQVFDVTQLQSSEPLVDASLGVLCRRLVHDQWRYYGDPKYLVIWSIILGARSDAALMAEIQEWQKAAIAAHQKAISNMFRQYGLTPDRIQSIQYFVNAQLRGLALLQTVDDSPDTVEKQLEMLAQLLTAQMSAD